MVATQDVHGSVGRLEGGVMERMEAEGGPRTEVPILEQGGVLFHVHRSVLHPLGVRYVGCVYEEDVLCVCHIRNCRVPGEEGTFSGAHFIRVSLMSIARRHARYSYCSSDRPMCTVKTHLALWAR